QFRDSRFLTQLDQHGGSLFRFIEEFQDLEHRTNSSHGPNPKTWEKNGSTMFYRTRPRQKDRDT
ncbi:hypothetical protein K439DRAFT_1357177, partial [Ramaria rubella]